MMMKMLRDILIFLILIKGSVYCCHDVRTNCFSGQFGYTDVDNMAISIHLAATNRECSTETRRFCSQYENLKQCIIKHVGSCEANNTIWKQWEAMDSLNYSICSSANTILSQYEECVQTVEVSQKVSQCYSPLSWNSSTCALVPNRNATNDQCQNEDHEKIENCLESVVSSKCPDDVGKSLTSHFASSYLSKVCSNDSGDHPAECSIFTNAQLMEDVKNCRSRYGNGFSGIIGGVVSPGDQLTEICRLGRNYVKCKLDRTVAHCGMAHAIADKQRIAQTYGTFFQVILCDLDEACTDAEQCGKQTTAITFQPELNKTTDNPSSINRHLIVIVTVPTVCLLVLAIAVPVIIVKSRNGCIHREEKNIIYGTHTSLDFQSISTVSSANSSNIYSRISDNAISESALPKESTVKIEASNP